FNIASIFMGASIVGVYAGGAGGGAGHGGTGSDRFPRSDPLWMGRHQHGRWQGESGGRVQFRSCASPGVVAWVGATFAPDGFHPWRDPSMPPTTPPPSHDREQLRQQWLAAANDAFERMFAEAEQDYLVTFLQRETRACLLGDELAAWLLERHVSSDPPRP